MFYLISSFFSFSTRFGQVSPKPKDKIPPLDFEGKEHLSNGYGDEREMDRSKFSLFITLLILNYYNRKSKQTFLQQKLKQRNNNNKSKQSTKIISRQKIIRHKINVQKSKIYHLISIIISHSSKMNLENCLHSTVVDDNFKSSRLISPFNVLILKLFAFQHFYFYRYI